MKMRPNNPAGRWIWTHRFFSPPEKVELLFSPIGPNTVDGNQKSGEKTTERMYEAL